MYDYEFSLRRIQPVKLHFSSNLIHEKWGVKEKQLLEGASISGNLSIRLSANLGSVLSVKESFRTEGSVSACAGASVGSSASVRSFMRLGSGISFLSDSCVGASVSAIGATRLGSACSLRWTFIDHVGTDVSIL